MKKTGWTLLIFLCVTFCSYSQVQIAIKAGPTITFNRFLSNTDSIAIDNTRDDTRFTAGLVTDFEFSDNYFFSTGVLYSLRKLSFAAVNLNTQESDAEQYTLEYIEIPLTLKLLTNDIGVDSRVYFQTGFTVDFLVGWKGINKNDTRIEDLNTFDSSFYVGTGFDKNVGVTNSFFIGAFYQRGMVNISKTDAITLKNDLLGLELGFRF